MQNGARNPQKTGPVCEDCKSLHAGSIPARASNSPRMIVPSTPTPSRVRHGRVTRAWQTRENRGAVQSDLSERAILLAPGGDLVGQMCGRRFA